MRGSALALAPFAFGGCLPADTRPPPAEVTIKVASRSLTTSAVTPSAFSKSASAFARSAVRFQISTRAIDGRTARCERTSHFAISPAPATNIVLGSGRESRRVPSALSAAVRQ